MELKNFALLHFAAPVQFYRNILYKSNFETLWNKIKVDKFKNKGSLSALLKFSKNYKVIFKQIYQKFHILGILAALYLPEHLFFVLFLLLSCAQISKKKKKKKISLSQLKNFKCCHMLLCFHTGQAI